MKRITVYHNEDCARCRRIARTHRFFDWLNRLEISTAVPPSGPLKLGEIVVVEAGSLYRGIDAVRHIFRQIPAYLLLRPFLHIPFIARKIDADVRGCNDDSCAR